MQMLQFFSFNYTDMVNHWKLSDSKEMSGFTHARREGEAETVAMELESLSVPRVGQVHKVLYLSNFYFDHIMYQWQYDFSS